MLRGWMAIVGTAEHGFPVKGEVSHSAEDNCHARKRYMSWLYNGSINAAAMPPGLPTLLFCFLGSVVVVGLSRMPSTVLLLACTPRQSRGGAVCRTCLRRSDAFQAAAQPRDAAQTCGGGDEKSFLRCHLAPFTMATMRQVRRRGRVDGLCLGLCSIRASASSLLVMKAGAAQRAKISTAATPPTTHHPLTTTLLLHRRGRARRAAGEKDSAEAVLDGRGMLHRCGIASHRPRRTRRVKLASEGETTVAHEAGSPFYSLQNLLATETARLSPNRCRIPVD